MVWTKHFIWKILFNCLSMGRRNIMLHFVRHTTTLGCRIEIFILHRISEVRGTCISVDHTCVHFKKVWNASQRCGSYNCIHNPACRLSKYMVSHLIGATSIFVVSSKLLQTTRQDLLFPLHIWLLHTYPTHSPSFTLFRWTPEIFHSVIGFQREHPSL